MTQEASYLHRSRGFQDADVAENLTRDCLNPDHRVFSEGPTTHGNQAGRRGWMGPLSVSVSTSMARPPWPAKAGSPSRGHPEGGGALVSSERGGDGDFLLKALLFAQRTHRGY